MSYIYKITNSINQKIYIGMTNKSIKERWEQHKKDFSKTNQEKRPLYSAMRKYGICNFTISEIEECSKTNVCEREKYWINFYNSYNEGYNGSLGGEGNFFIDSKLVIEEYQILLNMSEVAKKLNISRDSVRSILNQNEILIIPSEEIMRQKTSKAVEMLSLDNNYLQTFESLKSAGRFIIQKNNLKDNTISLNGICSHIRDCANGKRKTAYQHKWKYISV